MFKKSLIGICKIFFFNFRSVIIILVGIKGNFRTFRWSFLMKIQSKPFLQYLNDQLVDMNMPLRLVDGFIGSIRICIPWRSLMGESTKVSHAYFIELLRPFISPFSVSRRLTTGKISSALCSALRVITALNSSVNIKTNFLPKTQNIYFKNIHRSKAKNDQSQPSFLSYAKEAFNGERHHWKTAESLWQTFRGSAFFTSCVG